MGICISTEVIPFIRPKTYVELNERDSVLSIVIDGQEILIKEMMKEIFKPIIKTKGLIHATDRRIMIIGRGNRNEIFIYRLVYKETRLEVKESDIIKCRTSIKDYEWENFVNYGNLEIERHIERLLLRHNSIKEDLKVVSLGEFRYCIIN